MFVPSLYSLCYYHAQLTSSRTVMGNFIWVSAMILEAGILLRGSSGKLLKSYPLFFGYIGSVLTIDLLRYGCNTFNPGFYPEFYWYSEFVVILASYGVILEIYKRSFKNHPGVARHAQGLLILALCITAGGVLANTWFGGFQSWFKAIGLLDCDLRYVEGGLLVVILILLGTYRIPMNRNLLGLVAGYAFWVGVNVINLVLLSHPGNEFSVLLRQVLPVTYLVALCIWCFAFWSPRPDPPPPPEDEIERDYRVLVSKTRALFTRLSDHLVRGSRT